MLYFNTRHSGSDHLTAKDEAAVNAGLFGALNAVLSAGGSLELTVEPSSGTATVDDGVFSFNGRVGWIDGSEAVSFTQAGGDSVYKKVLVGILYERDAETGAETAALAAYETEDKITEASAEETIIECPSDVISSASTEAFMPLWEFICTASAVTKTEKRFATISNMAELMSGASEEEAARAEADTALSNRITANTNSIATETSQREALAGRVTKLESVADVAPRSILRLDTERTINVTGKPIAFSLYIRWGDLNYEINHVGNYVTPLGYGSYFYKNIVRKTSVSAEQQPVRLKITNTTNGIQLKIHCSDATYLAGASFVGATGATIA